MACTLIDLVHALEVIGVREIVHGSVHGSVSVDEVLIGLREFVSLFERIV